MKISGALRSPSGLRIVALFLLLCFTLTRSERDSRQIYGVDRPATDPNWPMQLSLRMSRLRSRIPTVDRVAIVPDEATFLFAISQWSLAGRWPILIDDRRYTQLFLRKFRPAEVIRIKAVRHSQITGAQRRQEMERAVAATWCVANPSLLKARWQEVGWDPPGVVITSEDDPSWPAAVALAAAWGQPLQFLSGEFGLPNATLNPQDWLRLKAEIQQLVAETGYSYQALGDTIDTVTVVRRMAVKYQPNEQSRQNLAVTDGLARDSQDRRWAFVGWIFGSPARSVYQAMCSIFLDRQTALLYNSYPQEDDWLVYGMKDAALELEQVGLHPELVESPNAKLSTWQNLGKNGLGFDLILVNSRGGKAEFDVGNGQASVRDIPELLVPAIVHFIHSWSAVEPDDVNTVAGRWLDNGSYIYIGSVDEPFLSAFMPPRVLARRLLASVPFLIAARYPNAPPWKVTTIGDPLAILFKPRQRLSPRALPLTKLSVSQKSTCAK